jgi:hypothetical protein
MFSERRKIVKGDLKLSVISMKWENQDYHSDKSRCLRIFKKVSSFYERNSRGLLKFTKRDCVVVPVPFKAQLSNLYKAEDYCKRKYPGADIYCIINNKLKKGSNAGNGTAHLRDGTFATANHEVGHLLGLGHSGRYEWERVKGKPKGKPVLDNYGDPYSVMGRYPASLITAPQYYHNGWMFEKECVDYSIDSGPQTFELKRLGILDVTDKLTAVRIPNPDPKRRPAFVSFTTIAKRNKPLVSLHLTNGGGSQLIADFTSEYTDDYFTGLKIKIIKNNTTSVLVTISHIDNFSSPDSDSNIEEIEDGDDFNMIDEIDDVLIDDEEDEEESEDSNDEDNDTKGKGKGKGKK